MWLTLESEGMKIIHEDANSKKNQKAQKLENKIKRIAE